ncbi:hypothetical protein PLESTB_000254300 [Pleodorina starrii]|uniref:Uncharacterized protein n=1 Tax=Pleodorina starrii TaxID=330485 RepID=A0A9W6BCH7_9CHLO|nr:hypothetical protein PLESTM_000470600 [Pleodorina starrii]GLC49549.1 hypothetical protein PLESTB_000254300 [Pleodorina starrii]GLC76795.1 hypothetical protein PLESTF_001836000 [Pleodorina starrii]
MKGHRPLPAGTSCITEGCAGSAVQKFRRNQPVCPKCYVAAFEAFKEKLDLRCLELVQPRADGEPCHIRCTFCKTTLAANVRPDELKVHKHTQPSAAALGPGPAEPTGQQRPTFLQCMLAHGPSPADLPWLNAPSSQRIHTALLRGLPLLLTSLTLVARRASEQPQSRAPMLPEHHHPTFMVALKKWERLTNADASGYMIRSSREFKVLPARDDTDGLFDVHLTDLGEGKVLLRIPTRIQERVYKVYGVGENAAAVLQADGSVKPWPVEYFYMLDGFTHAIADFEQASWRAEQLLDYRNAEPDLEVPVAGIRGSHQLEQWLDLTPQDPEQLRFADKVRELSQHLEALRNPERRREAEVKARASFSSETSSGPSGAGARAAAGESGSSTAAAGPQPSSLGAGPWPLGLTLGAGTPPTALWPGHRAWALEAGIPTLAMGAAAALTALWPGHESLALEAGLPTFAMGPGVPPAAIWPGHQPLALTAGLPTLAMGVGTGPTALRPEHRLSAPEAGLPTAAMRAVLRAGLLALAPDAERRPRAPGTGIQPLLPGAGIDPLALGAARLWPFPTGPELLPTAVEAVATSTFAAARHVAQEELRPMLREYDVVSPEPLSAAYRVPVLASPVPSTGCNPAVGLAGPPVGNALLGAAPIGGVVGAAAWGAPPPASSALPPAWTVDSDEGVDEDEELAAQGLLDLSGGVVAAPRKGRPRGKRN